ncbi:MAG: hypothetical protein ACRDRE_23625 [Pseudonocardiaceae bacterium]
MLGTRRNYARFVRRFCGRVRIWLSSPCGPTFHSLAVTHQYLDADLAAQEAVLQRLADPNPTPT